MTRRQSFLRKIKYLGVIVVLLLPLSWLSRPAAINPNGQRAPGGTLAQMRDQYRLGQANLGEIDPTSEAIKLATLGMRGVAANILWSKANHYRKVEDWTSLSATLEQITKLQPNFITVWRYQAWNLSYNISVEWDDYRDRYFWVMKGIDFLKEGTRYNQEEPRLLWDIGWFVSHKIGMADERTLFRRLFREDDLFHGNRPLSQRDNWLVGKEWFETAEQMVDRGVPLQGTSPLIFYSKAPLCQISYATAMEQDGTFGEPARLAWDQAYEDWSRYGDREFVIGPDERARLNDLEKYMELEDLARQELEELQPGLMERVFQEKMATLTEAERTAISKAPRDRTVEEFDLAMAAAPKVSMTYGDVLEYLEGEDRTAAEAVVSKVNDRRSLVQALNGNRQIVNYDYWKMRCDVERSAACLQVRELTYRGAELLADADLEGARQAFEEAFVLWRQILDENPALQEDGLTGEDMFRVIVQYNEVLRQLDLPFPRAFVLNDVIEEHRPASIPLPETEETPE